MMMNCNCNCYSDSSSVNNMGTILQGQIASLTMRTEYNEVLDDKDVYLGVYNDRRKNILLISTEDSTITKIVDTENNQIIYSAVILPSITSVMKAGTYSLEVLIKNDDESYVNVCRNVLYFNISSRNIKEVLE